MADDDRTGGDKIATPTGGMALSELILRVGDDNIFVDPLLQRVTNVRQVGGPARGRRVSQRDRLPSGVSVTFFTQHSSVAEIGGMVEPTLIPLVIWLPYELAQQAKREHAAAIRPAHVYLSTACQHEQHGDCRKLCKFCATGCTCRCHW